MADYKEKIKKLLALAESPNEYEAKAALLKAKELMAEHKLTEAELKEAEAQAVKEVITKVTFSKRRNPWVALLSMVIGENFCCKAWRTAYYGKQIHEIGFTGLEDDVEVCEEIFGYAVDCALSAIKCVKKNNQCYHSSYVKKLCDSYGYGFVCGVADSFSKQQEEKAEEGWGLVMTLPKEVIEATRHMKSESFHSRAEEEIHSGTYFNGYAEGKKFNPSRRLKEHTTTRETSTNAQ